MVFHDSSDFNAEAVVFNFERMLDEDHPYHDTGPFPLAFFFDAIAEVEATGEHEVTFTLDKPYAPFLSNLTYPTGLIVSPAAVEEHGENFGRNPSGTGPFRFEEWESNSRVVASRNENYWDGPPSLEAVVFRPITDANTRVAEMMMVEVPPVPEGCAFADHCELVEPACRRGDIELIATDAGRRVRYIKPLGITDPATQGAVVETISDRIAVMYFDRVIEQSPSRQLFHLPAHPYTRLLLGSAPIPGGPPIQAVAEGRE
ncbi:ABC transporter substrate-binding protein [Halomonas korlensis]|uniref:ABC transporter substrate-binding protein n=1 Tax=Halomonas korlensis TaxID=463301 RepID=UPI000B15E85A|nr:ABC transporter substrate-binding protein [Halomonas korlensis]